MVLDEKKKERLIAELKTRFGTNTYFDILTLKIDWLFSIGVSVIAVSNSALFDEENIRYGGKVVWDKTETGKRPTTLMLNMVDYQDTEFIAIILHECGHIKDKDDATIRFATPESEISAWKHAIDDFKCVPTGRKDKEIFSAVLKRGLISYGVEESIIESLLTKITVI